MKINPPSITTRTPAQLALTSLAMLALASCQLGKLTKSSESKKEADAEQLYPQPAPVELTPEAKEVNDAARLLAGLPALADQDSNKKWRGEDFWKAHKTGMDKMWKEFSSKRGIKVRKWAATEVADVESTPVVFQPFGGPDFTFSHLMFPNAETFVVCGKAPCIDVPKLAEVTPDIMAETVFNLRTTSAALLKVEHEKEKQAAQAPQVPRQVMPGALPTLLALAARTGHIVESVELMPTDEAAPAPVAAGEIPLDPMAAANAAASHSHPSSACVITLRTGDGKARRLFYFQQDLTDEGLPGDAALLRFLNKQPRVVVVVNETGHELHQTNTLRLQQYIAKHAVALIQDPSGVPYRHFSPDAWNIRRYGNYAGAPSEFRQFDQPELIAAYNDNSSQPEPLPFGTGQLGKEMPTAMLIARPLVTSASELPVNVEVQPLPEPAAPEPAVTSAGPPLVTSTSASSATSAAQVTNAPVTNAPVALQPAPVPSSPTPAVPLTSADSSTADPSTAAIEASLGIPLAPVDLAPRRE
jgi:hypothetical protein